MAIHAGSLNGIKSMYCWKCGKENREDAMLCMNCGADFLRPEKEETARDSRIKPCEYRLLFHKEKQPEDHSKPDIERGLEELIKLQGIKRKRIPFILFVVFIVLIGVGLSVYLYQKMHIIGTFLPASSATPNMEVNIQKRNETLTPTPSLQPLAKNGPPLSPVPKDWEIVSFGHYEQDNISIKRGGRDRVGGAQPVWIESASSEPACARLPAVRYQTQEGDMGDL